MSVTLETISAKLDQVLEVLAKGSGASDTPAAEVLRAEDINANGAWQPEWLKTLAARVAPLGNPDHPRLDGFAGAVVAVQQLAVGRDSLRVIQVPRGIYTLAVIDAADEAGILLTDKQAHDIRRNVGQSDGLATGADVAPVAWEWVGPFFMRAPGFITIRGGMQKRPLAQVKAAVIAWVANQAAIAGVKLDTSGI